MYLSRICVSNASYYSHCHMFTGGTNKTPLDHLHLVWSIVPVVQSATKFIILEDTATMTSADTIPSMSWT